MSDLHDSAMPIRDFILTSTSGKQYKRLMAEWNRMADLINDTQAERNALRAERDEWKARAETHLHQREAALQVWEAAEVRISRLEEALSLVSSDLQVVVDNPPHPPLPEADRHLRIARNALSQDTER
jgi:chromosome segregation ATPase